MSYSHGLIPRVVLFMRCTRLPRDRSFSRLVGRGGVGRCVAWQNFSNAVGLTFDLSHVTVWRLLVGTSLAVVALVQ